MIRCHMQVCVGILLKKHEFNRYGISGRIVKCGLVLCCQCLRQICFKGIMLKGFKKYIIDKNYFVDICMQRAWFEDTDRRSFL